MADQADEVTATSSATLDDAREFVARWSWTEALTAARSVTPGSGRPEGDRLDILAESSWWLGRLDDCIEAREQAYTHYLDAGELRRAGQCAVWLWEHHGMRARPAIANAWLRRARRAVGEDVESVEYGHLILREAEGLHGSGDLKQASAMAREALTLGQVLGSIDLEAEALQTLGRVLIDQGAPAEGLGHLDEAMLSAVEGKLRPYTTGKVHCSMISACEELGDLHRATEWTDATSRWSERHPFAMWPGICRVHHAALLQARGDWDAAEREARQACAELSGFHLPNVAAGYVEIGEIRRRLGDLRGAEEAFATAEDMSGQQSAGLALVRLAQGRIDEASGIITRMLAEQSWNQLTRAKLLPARVQIAVAADDLGAAEDATAELERIAAEYASPLLMAAGLTCRGRVQLAAGKSAAACGTLRDALHRWQELEVPYEEATVRLLLGQGCRQCGDDDGAGRSLANAAAIFDRLGASLDARSTRDLTTTAQAALPAELTAREAEVLRLVASGQTNKEMAASLFLSERTVARHLSNIFTKIGATSRTAAAAFAYEHGLA
ncbi:MAG: LuxR C-terminal-related transcriptional regulator [Acidimicrobiales bacterium]